MSKTSVKTTVEWNRINWKQLEGRVDEIQKRIYQASLEVFMTRSISLRGRMR